MNRVTRWSASLQIAAALGWAAPAIGQASSIPAPPGILVDMGGYKLHLNCTGTGSPTVILEAAFGGSSLDWEKVQPFASKTTRVCSYDRAGFGWSDAGSKSPSSKNIAEELHRLLEKAEVAGPYILGAHSLGGLHIRMFAALYPTEVMAILFVDASHEDQFGWRVPTYWAIPTPKDLPAEKQFPDIKRTKAAQSIVAAMSQRQQWKDAINKENNAIAESVEQLRSVSLPNIPLIVLSAGPNKPLEGYWTDRELRHNQMQANLLSLSPRAVQVWVPESDHYIHLDRADLVVDSIGRLVTLARQSSKK